MQPEFWNVRRRVNAAAARFPRPWDEHLAINTSTTFDHVLLQLAFWNVRRRVNEAAAPFPRPWDGHLAI